MTARSILCVVVNWNGAKDTLACARAVRAQEHPADLVVVDNGSSDDSLRQLQAHDLTVLASSENLGFAGGVNIGLRHGLRAGYDAFWLLNNDADPAHDVLEGLVLALDADERNGLVGSRLVNIDGTTQAVGGGTVSLRTGVSRNYLDHWSAGASSYVTFASVLIRRAVVEEIGLLDDGYFMYYEDADLCLRAQSAGWRLAVADVDVVHAEGGSSQDSRTKARVITASGMRFLSNYGRPPWFAAFLYFALRIGARLARRDWGAVRAVLKGAVDHARGEPRAFQFTNANRR